MLWSRELDMKLSLIGDMQSETTLQHDIYIYIENFHVSFYEMEDTFEIGKNKSDKNLNYPK